MAKMTDKKIEISTRFGRFMGWWSEVKHAWRIGGRVSLMLLGETPDSALEHLMNEPIVSVWNEGLEQQLIKDGVPDTDGLLYCELMAEIHKHWPQFNRVSKIQLGRHQHTMILPVIDDVDWTTRPDLESMTTHFSRQRMDFQHFAWPYYQVHFWAAYHPMTDTLYINIHK